MSKFLNNLILMGLIVCGGILMVQLLLIFFQLVNRFFIQCMAIIFYVFILLYVTFGGVNSAIPYDFSDFLFPLMVTVWKHGDHRMMYLSEMIFLIMLIVTTIISGREKWKQSAKAALHSWLG
ncbi:hypothetical protein BCY89_00325 [Sphingobacterium siyangense]|uniref:Uncharacterized protein n=2 Tax=Sphingobacterium TaxID=28453 RepID=A0A420G9X3_9SPHI|nr:hypothetical protein BCY89_00325 [Sphingobacterium siyangense]